MPLKIHPAGLTVAIRLTPNARKNGFDGVMDVGDGKKALKVSINAVPEDGKANKALLAFLAESWDVPKSALSLLSGTTNRLKVIFIEGDSSALMARVTPFTR